jgi:hypothetical protein
MTNEIETTSSTRRDRVTVLVLVGVLVSELRRDGEQRRVKR